MPHARCFCSHRAQLGSCHRRQKHARSPKPLRSPTDRSEKPELLAGSAEDLVLLHLEHVEAHRLAQRPALAHSQDVALLHVEGWGAVRGQVGVALLKTVEFLDVVEVVAPDNDRPLHLARDCHALQNFAADANVPREGALLVDEIALLCLLRRAEAEAYVAPVAKGLLASLLPEQALRADEHGVLLLEGLLGLIHGRETPASAHRAQSCRDGLSQNGLS